MAVFADSLQSGGEREMLSMGASGGKWCYSKVIAKRGFDPRTSGLWAQHASTAPLCYKKYQTGEEERLCAVKKMNAWVDWWRNVVKTISAPPDTVTFCFIMTYWGGNAVGAEAKIDVLSENWQNVIFVHKKFEAVFSNNEDGEALIY